MIFQGVLRMNPRRFWFHERSPALGADSHAHFQSVRSGHVSLHLHLLAAAAAAFVGYSKSLAHLVGDSKVIRQKCFQPRRTNVTWDSSAFHRADPLWRSVCPSSYPGPSNILDMFDHDSFKIEEFAATLTAIYQCQIKVPSSEVCATDSRLFVCCFMVTNYRSKHVSKENLGVGK